MNRCLLAVEFIVYLIGLAGERAATVSSLTSLDAKRMLTLALLANSL
jgi:hypothetical protein